MNYKNWLLDDLKDFEKLKSAEEHLYSEIQTAKAERSALKATVIDKMPSATGVNTSEESMLNVIARIDALEKAWKATHRKVKDIQSLLDKLSPEEYKIIERIVIKGKKAEELATELGYDVRQIYNKRNAILRTLAVLRWGADYRP